MGRRFIHEQGITYHIYGDPQGQERAWRLDPIPLIIDAAEWRTLESALIQRATLLNHIPLAALAAVLIATGIKLASPALIMDAWRRGPQFLVPFAVTTIAIVVEDLLIGIGVGLAAGLFFVLRDSYRNAYSYERRESSDHQTVRMDRQSDKMDKWIERLVRVDSFFDRHGAHVRPQQTRQAGGGKPEDQDSQPSRVPRRVGFDPGQAG